MGVDLHGATPTAGSGSTIFLRPGHGCNGDATNALTVTIPDGVTGAKAQQKAGWKVTSDGKTITWSGEPSQMISSTTSGSNSPGRNLPMASPRRSSTLRPSRRAMPRLRSLAVARRQQ